MNNYYIYIYLDPRKTGKYIYDNYCFLYEPFYVGKGKDGRWKDLNNRNKYFKNKINKIKKLGLTPIVKKIKENLNEYNSFILESKLINLIGRNDLKYGPYHGCLFCNKAKLSVPQIKKIKSLLI